MRIELIIENDEDFSKVKSFLVSTVTKVPVKIKTNKKDLNRKLDEFLDFIHNTPFKVDSIDIPSREERNAR